MERAGGARVTLAIVLAGATLALAWLSMDVRAAARELQSATEQTSQLRSRVEAAEEALVDSRSSLTRCGCLQPTVITDPGPRMEYSEVFTALAGEHVAALMEQTVRWPDGSDHSWASVLIGPWQEFVKDRTVLPTALDRVCTDDSALLLTLRRTLAEAGLPDIYGFLAGSGAHWCPAAVEPGGRVGFMRMGESAARGALGLEVALEDHVERLERIDALARRQGTVAKRLHARCGPELAALDTEGDPRLDPEGAIRAGVGWLAELHRGFAGRGWSDLDTVGLTLLAYDIGPLEVEAWIQAAVHEYGVGDEAAIGFIEILGGGVHVMSGASGSDGRGRHGDAIRLPTEVLGAALAMPPMLDETCWSDLERVGE